MDPRRQREGHWWRHIKFHQGDLAAIFALVHIVLRAQLQLVVAHHKAKSWQPSIVLTVGQDVQLLLKILDDLSWSCKLGSTSVHSNLTILAQGHSVSIDGDVLNLDLPISRFP